MNREKISADLKYAVELEEEYVAGFAKFVRENVGELKMEKKDYERVMELFGKLEKASKYHLKTVTKIREDLENEA